MASWHRVGPYESAALREAKAESARKKLQKKNPNIRPVILKDRVIARNWWAKAWCQNLERHAEFAPHIEQGRSYVRYGAVLDLQISPGLITAVVQGSRERPYKMQIHIDPIAPTDWRPLRQRCRGHLDSLQALWLGQFPKSLADQFMRPEQGLFPRPEQIHFECTCPEGDGLCKHLLAVLYGVGARLDEAPEMLFLLRQVDPEALVHPVVEDPQQELGGAAAQKPASARVGADAKRRMVRAATAARDIPKKNRSEADAGQARRRRIVVAPVARQEAPADAPQARKGRPAARAKSGEASTADKIVALICQSPQGIDTAALQRRTGLSVAAIRAAVYTALRKGLIRRVGWGLYKGA